MVGNPNGPVVDLRWARCPGCGFLFAHAIECKYRNLSDLEALYGKENPMLQWAKEQQKRKE